MSKRKLLVCIDCGAAKPKKGDCECGSEDFAPPMSEREAAKLVKELWALQERCEAIYMAFDDGKAVPGMTHDACQSFYKLLAAAQSMLQIAAKQVPG